MALSLLMKGILIGFLVAMPVGPIGMLCIRNSLTKGMKFGFATGLGAALADSIFGMIAGFSVVILSTFLIEYHTTLRFLGSGFLFVLGVLLLLKARPVKEKNSPDKLLKVFLTAFFLTLTNPLTIISFTAIYAAFGISLGECGLYIACSSTLGIFIGSALWWFLLSSGTAMLKHHVTDHASLWLNRISGIVLIVSGLAVLLIY